MGDVDDTARDTERQPPTQSGEVAGPRETGLLAFPRHIRPPVLPRITVENQQTSCRQKFLTEMQGDREFARDPVLPVIADILHPGSSRPLHPANSFIIQSAKSSPVLQSAIIASASLPCIAYPLHFK
ncbi:unnamed protein product [Leuciscus chuanchicus]